MKDEAAVAAAQKACDLGPQPGERYRHYKGGEYVVIDRAVDEPTLTPLVVYLSIARGGKWVRTAENFTQRVDEHGEPSPTGKPRFERIDE